MNEAGNDRGRVTEVLPGLHAMRERFGARSPEGFRCSNMAEGLDNRVTATGEQKTELDKSIARQAAELQRLTAVI